MKGCPKNCVSGASLTFGNCVKIFIALVAACLSAPAFSVPIPPLLVAEYTLFTSLSTGNTPSVATGTDFGEAHRALPVTRMYTLRHYYPNPAGPFPQSATINILSSTSPDFVVDGYTCAPLPYQLTPPSPVSCEIKVTFHPTAPISGNRAAVIQVDWYQAGTNLSLSFNVAGVAIPQPCTLDIDGDGSVYALTDGLIMLRAMFGLTGTAVTSGAIGPNATRSAWMAAVNPTVDNSVRLYLNAVCGRDFAP